MNQYEQAVSASLRTRSLLGLSLSTGSSYLRVPDGELLPFTQNLLNISYNPNTAPPTSISYARGAYYHGFLTSMYSSTGLRLSGPLTFSLEIDATHYVPHDAYALETRWKEIATI